jgi:hypothetical protein
MIPLPSAISGGLSWSKIQRGRGYELRVNDEVVGTLRRPSFWSMTFVAETAEGRWKFRRGGFWRTGTEILDESSQQQIATFKSGWSSAGTLTFADGQKFRVERKGLWRQVWSVMTESGQPVLRWHTREKRIELPGSAAIPSGRASVLILFARYRALQAEEDAASAATVAVIASS